MKNKQYKETVEQLIIALKMNLQDLEDGEYEDFDDFKYSCKHYCNYVVNEHLGLI